MTETLRSLDPAHVIESVIERVFTSVSQVRGLMLGCHRHAQERGRELSDRDVAELAPAIKHLLRRPDQIAVGLGVILEPGLLGSHPLRIEWWQSNVAHDQPVALEVDLHPDSLGFYDYAATEWFAVPRRTRRRHIVGPYVDVHGTGRYLLTLTMPVEADGIFLGVAGADVPMSRFETLVLRSLGTAVDAVVVNEQGRVVLSTSSLWITGSRLPATALTQVQAIPTLPWALFEPTG